MAGNVKTTRNVYGFKPYNLLLLRNCVKLLIDENVFELEDFLRKRSFLCNSTQSVLRVLV